MLDDLKDLGFSAATRAGISIGVDDMVIPQKKEDYLNGARKEVLEVESQRNSGVITAGERHNKIIDIWHRTTENISDEMFKEMKKSDQAGQDFNPDLHHGRFGRPGIEGAGASARGHAGSDVQAFRRGHRDADHRELPRGALGAAVLHLHARRAQGSGRHGLEDRGLGLPDAPLGRRGPGRDRHRGRLRNVRRHHGVRDHGGRRHTRAAARPHRGPRVAGGHLRSADRGEARRLRRRDRRGSRHRASRKPASSESRSARF